MLILSARHDSRKKLKEILKIKTKHKGDGELHQW